MNQTIPPEQDVDRLLRAFFSREMPNPWPAFTPPQRQVVPARPATPGRFAVGSRFALAASVAVLLACGWLLSGSFSGPNAARGPGLDTVIPHTGTADTNKGKHQDVPMPPIDFQPDPVTPP